MRSNILFRTLFIPNKKPLRERKIFHAAVFYRGKAVLWTTGARVALLRKARLILVDGLVQRILRVNPHLRTQRQERKKAIADFLARVFGGMEGVFSVGW